MAMVQDRRSEKKPGQSAREERLAAQLRENLKRRKVQARARKNRDNTGNTPESDGNEAGQT